MPHRLDPLLRPRSIAFVGASPRPDTVGNDMIRAIRDGGFPGPIYPINPKYDEIEGIKTYPSLDRLPEAVDHVVLALANPRLEEHLSLAVAHGAKAATIFASCYLEDDRDPPLRARIARIAREAGMRLCGGNSMGFYNTVDKTAVTGWAVRNALEPGPVALISHSGSVWSAFLQLEARFGYSYAISPGQELGAAVDEYLDYVLEEESTGVVGLFLEAVRHPRGFSEALEKAAARDVPVVVLRVGRTEQSAAMALTHCGAMVGSEAAYEAVFERYGVIRVETMDEMAATLALFAAPRRPPAGGIAAIHDSGGERELLVDLAADLKVPLARISPETEARLAERLEPGLEPENPLDAWETGYDYENVFAECFAALMDDPDTAIGLFCADIRDGQYLDEAYGRACTRVAEGTGKPVVLATNLSNLVHPQLVKELAAAGVPVLEGTQTALLAVRHMLAHRDFRDRSPLAPPPGLPEATGRRWRRRLAEGGVLDEGESLALLADYGVPVLPHRIVESATAAEAAARELGFPLALKTAMPGISHKSDVDGVMLGLEDAAQLGRAYDDLARRLGPRVLVAPMAPKGAEMALGVTIDPQFGPLVMVAGGGALIELLRDRRYALPPLDARAARRMIDALASRPLLDGARGAPAADIDALAEAAARLSVLAAELGDRIAEVDVNPVIVSAKGCVAVDALVVPR